MSKLTEAEKRQYFEFQKALKTFSTNVLYEIFKGTIDEMNCRKAQEEGLE